jgi:hypothetical protein
MADKKTGIERPLAVVWLKSVGNGLTNAACDMASGTLHVHVNVIL